MILVERREMIEAIFKEILGVLDFEVYRPLGDFMDAFPHIDSLVKTVRKISNKMRSVLAKQRLNYVSLLSFFLFFPGLKVSDYNFSI